MSDVKSEMGNSESNSKEEKEESEKDKKEEKPKRIWGKGLDENGKPADRLGHGT